MNTIFTLNAINTLLQNCLSSTSQFLRSINLTFGQTSISLESILQLLVSFIAVIILSRFINKFLKNKLLVKFGIDEGNREALATIITYITGSVGLVIFLESTGFNLASLAVLAGGLGIGLGFAIQNITENFISGLTLLIERSVKVGDFIELWIVDEFDTLQGTIKKISLRSTIIQTIDGACLVMPNSNLVQKPILNWKYENNNYRITIPVKVEYGSDPLAVTEALLNSAYLEQYVLKEPSPKVNFNGLADGLLDFELNVWVDRADKRTDIRSSLNFIIEYNLRLHGIALPQMSTDINQNILPPKQEYLNEKNLPPLSLRVLLREVTYFQNFSDIELRQLIEIGYRQRLRTSTILFRENDPGDAFYIVLSGSVEVFVEKINKNLATITSGKFFGELALMLAIPRTATVRALEDTTLFVINNKGFEQLLKSHPNLAEDIVQELSKHQEELVMRQQQLREMGLVDATEDDTNPVVWVRNRLKKVFNL